MKKNILLTLIGLLTLTLASCNQTNSKVEQSNNPQNTPSELIKTVMTKEQQDKLTPDEVLEDLLDGNNRFLTGKMINRDLTSQITETIKGQYPKAIVLSCIDSRVPDEYIFDQGIGDIFVARVAGNIESKKLLGSIEYGTAVAGAKLIIVMGHENCGAIKTAISKQDYGSKNVEALIKGIEPAIIEAEKDMNSNDKDFLNKVTIDNITQTVDRIRIKSDIIRNLEEEEKVKIVGAYYSLEDGKVTILD